MISMEERVLVDADFLNRFDALKSDDGKQLFKNIFDHLGKKPCVHYYVYDNELFYNKTAKELVTEGYITRIELKEIAFNKLSCKAYCNEIEDLYYQANSEYFPVQFDPLEGRLADRNLGEIHSIVTALRLGIELFCSNDYGSKDLAEAISYGSRMVIVKNIREIIEPLDFIKNHTKKALYPNRNHRE